MAKIFILGGMGYIGSAFAKEAVKHGHTVRLYDSLIYEQNRHSMQDELQMKYIIGDTRNVPSLYLELKDFKPDFVLHLAELSSVYACEHNPKLTEDVNYFSSMNVLECCSNLDIPVIYNSSSSVYGGNDLYVKYKLMMEERIKELDNVIVFRPATVFGASPRFRIELLPNHFTYMALKGKIPVSLPDAHRTAIDIQDLISAYLKVIEKGSWRQQFYDLGSHNLTKLEYAEEIQKIVPCEIEISNKVHDTRNIQIDSSEFYKEFDFKPQFTFAENVQKLADWMQPKIEEWENNNFNGMLNMPLDNFKKICS